MTPPRQRRAAFMREIGESKIDMGLMAPMSQDAMDASLYAAVLEDDPLAVRRMAGTKADPDMEADGKLGEPSGRLLHFAVRHASLKTVIALLHLGADPSLRDEEGRTPRDVALDRAGPYRRMRTVLDLWEKKQRAVLSSPAEDMDGGEEAAALERAAS